MIKLTWDVIPGQSVSIYKGTRRDQLTLLGTHDASVSEFVDTDVALRQIYYYRIDRFIGTDEVRGSIKPFCIYPDTGPGPQEIIRGDWDFGVFGHIANADFLMPDDFHDRINAVTSPRAAGVANLYDSPRFPNEALRPTHWTKFAMRGKVYFVPNGMFSNLKVTTNRTNALTTLIRSGLANLEDSKPYGVPTFIGSVSHGDPVVIDVGGYNFQVGIPSIPVEANGYTGDPSYLTVTKSQQALNRSDFNRLTMIARGIVTRGSRITDPEFCDRSFFFNGESPTSLYKGYYSLLPAFSAESNNYFLAAIDATAYQLFSTANQAVGIILAMRLID